MARLLLDATLLIDAVRGRPAADRLRFARRVEAESWMCAASVEEVWRGSLPHEERTIRRLLRGPRCAPIGATEGERAGRWRRDFASRGASLHQADCLIAAAAVNMKSTRWPVGS